MRHLLRTDNGLVEFYPVPSSVTFKHRMRVRDTRSVETPIFPCLEGLVALQHDKYVSPDSAAALAANLRFDACGNVTYLCPAFLKFLCSTYGTAKWSIRRIPSTVYKGKQLTLKTAYYPTVCKNVLANTVNPCKAKTHAHYGRGDTHPDSVHVLGDTVCCGCYTQLFEPDGWVNIESLTQSLDPGAYKSVIRPLRMVGLRYFLVGIIISHLHHQRHTSLEAVKTMGRHYLSNPHDFLAKHYKEEMQDLVYITDPLVWRLYLDLRKAKYVPDVTTAVEREYFGWTVTEKKLDKRVYGLPIRIPFEEEASRTLYQTIVIDKTKSIIMHNHMYVWLSSSKNVTAVLAEKGFELVDSIDARTWTNSPLPNPVNVCNAEYITWTQLCNMGDRVVFLYGNLESAVRGVGGGVFADLVISGLVPAKTIQGEWTTSSTLLLTTTTTESYASWTNHWTHCSIKVLLCL